MAIDDDVIMDSDAQERRFRSFVARPKQPPPEPVEAPTIADDEEIPLLTEIVNADALASAQIDAILDALRKDLENGVSRFPLVSDFGCSTGRFAEPDIRCFAEQFVTLAMVAAECLDIVGRCQRVGRNANADAALNQFLKQLYAAFRHDQVG